MIHKPWCGSKFYSVHMKQFLYGRWDFFAVVDFPTFATYNEAQMFAKNGELLTPADYKIMERTLPCHCDDPDDIDDEEL